MNVCKTKHLTNTRASGSDDALRLVPVSKFSLEGCLEFLAPDELLELSLIHISTHARCHPRPNGCPAPGGAEGLSWDTFIISFLRLFHKENNKNP